ncbi:MAG: DoxX family protein [Crocinitomicaceae bacterium]
MTEEKTLPKGAIWASYILQALIVVAFTFGAFNNMLKVKSATDMAVEMGYSEDSVVFLGIILLVAVIFYAIPKTCILGAILLTGWLGGAVATHIIHSDPVGQTLFPMIFGIIIWLILWLRMPKLRALIPIIK